jgi:gluconolactonase
MNCPHFTHLQTIAILVAVGISSASHGEEPSVIVAPDAQLEKVFDGGHFLEGPAAAPDGSIYFSDLTFSSQSGMQGGHIWRFDPRSGKTSIFRSPSGMSNGIIFDAEGRMLVAEGADFGGRKVSRTDMTTGKSYILAGLFEGRPFNAPNDIAIDRQGRVYFTDPRYLGHEPIDQPVMGVYRIDPDGSVHRIVSELWKPNGIAISPDQKTIYVVTVGDFRLGIFRVEGGVTEVEPPSMIHAFDLAPDGTAKNRRVAVTYPMGRHADGITVDAEGNVYAAVGDEAGHHGVYVYSPLGEELEYIPTPERAANVEFGRGDESNVLYVTATTSLYRIRLKKVDYHVSEGQGGQ